MSGKIVVSFGDLPYTTLSIDQANQFFLGCCDGLEKLGLNQSHKLVDLVEVVRVWPNSGLGTGGQVCVEVVVKWRNLNTKKSQVFYLTKGDDNRTIVRNWILTTTKELAGNLLHDLKGEAKEFSDRLNDVNLI